MEKPIIYYKVVAYTHPVTGEAVYRPQIVAREQTIPLDEIIRRAIDRGLIAGLKPSAAVQIANAICQQMYEEFVRGRGIKFGSYFYARLYLDGPTDADGRLTDANSINVRFQNGVAFRLTRDMFSFSNVEESDIPKLEFLLSSEDNAERDYLIRGAAVQLNGVNLFREGDAASKAECFEIDPETGVADDTPVATVTSFTFRGPNQLVCDWVAALDVGKRYRVVPSRSADGTRWFTGQSHECTVVAHE